MFKWLKLFGEQYIGLWLPGIVLFTLQEVPYMVMPLFKLESNPIMNMQESSVTLDICEKVLGSLCIVLIIFTVRENIPVFAAGSGIGKIGFISAIVVLLLNFFGWGLYFAGYQSVGVMMFLLLCSRRYIMFVSVYGGRTKY